MSGGAYTVGGIEISRTTSDPLPDEAICSVFYQMAEFANDDYVRQALQNEISHNGALQLPPVQVTNPEDTYRGRDATITAGPLQVNIPYTSSDPALAMDTRDISICVAIMENASAVQDPVLRASTQNGAKAGLQRIADVFAQHMTDYQSLGVSEIVQGDSVQVMWNNLPGTTQSRLERWEVGQANTQSLATLDAPENSYIDTSATHGKTYVYSVKNFNNGELITVGYSKRIGF